MRAAAVALALLAGGCSPRPGPGGGPRPTAPERHETTGTLRAIRRDGWALVIAGKAFPGWMDEMTMTYEADPKLSAGLKPGDRIRFTVERQGDAWPIVALSKLPAK